MVGFFAFAILFGSVWVGGFLAHACWASCAPSSLRPCGAARASLRAPRPPLALRRVHSCRLHALQIAWACTGCLNPRTHLSSSTFLPQVRLPAGGRYSRRFRRSDPLQVCV